MWERKELNVRSETWNIRYETKRITLYCLLISVVVENTNANPDSRYGCGFDARIIVIALWQYVMEYAQTV